jgi:hypothetical protein
MSPGQAETLEDLLLWAVIFAAFQFWPMYFLDWYRFAYIGALSLLTVLWIVAYFHKRRIFKERGFEREKPKRGLLSLAVLTWISFAIYVSVSAYINRPISASFVFVMATLAVILAFILAIVRFTFYAGKGKSKGQHPYA